MQPVNYFLVAGILLLESYSRCSSTAVRSRFSDEFARTKVVALCAATKAENPQLCLNRYFKNATFLRRVTVQCDKFSGDTCSAILAINHPEKAIMMAFRSTVRPMQLLMEIESNIMEKKVNWIAGGKVSEYFYNAFMDVWSAGIEDGFLNLSKTYEDYELWIVGHSLGGAMASLASSYIEKMKLFDGNRITVVTFGQPRTGDINYAKAYEKQIPNAFRVTHSRDVVPHVPLRSIQHYHHHKTEIFYNNNMTNAHYVECDEGESAKCSNHAIDASFEDHRRYFNVFISKWGRMNCAGDPFTLK